MPYIDHTINLTTLEAIYRQKYQEAVIRSAPLFLELALPELDPPSTCYDGTYGLFTFSLRAERGHAT